MNDERLTYIAPWVPGWIATMTGLLGVPVVISLVAMLLIAALVMLYLFLIFGEKGLKMFLPFVADSFDVLKSETKKLHHPSIRLELIYHGFLALIIVVCLCATVLHALIPWVRAEIERNLAIAFCCALIMFGLLACVSLVLSRHIKLASSKPRIAAK